MNKKGVAPIIMIAIYIGIGLMILSALGGFGLAWGLFKGLTSIPPVVYIVLAVLIVLLLIKK